MTATKFVLDEEAIKADPKYSLDGLYETIEEAAKRAHLKKVDKGYYVCYEDKNEPAYMGIFVFNYMSKIECFTKYLRSWVWVENNQVDDDIIRVLKNSNKGVWR